MKSKTDLGHMTRLTQVGACYHGGTFFKAVGEEFDALERRQQIIAADVLDAWFPPSPKVIAALEEDLPWLIKTSPPTHGEGLVRVIARVRGLAPENILPGAGSSDLIFLALQRWLDSASRVLILDPTYGEYAHVLENAVGCHVTRLLLSRQNHYRVDAGELEQLAQRDFDLIILVNPNSPTGQHLPRPELEELVRQVPAKTLVWVDETYIEYAGAQASLESCAARSKNVVVCKSMSKVYALSGVRAAYLCGPERILRGLRAFSPPWAVSLPAQVAAVAALQDPGYYKARYAQTHQLRQQLAERISSLEGWKSISGVANFLLCHLPRTGPSAAEIVECCRERGLFVRDAGAMGKCLGDRALRIAVKDASTNEQMIAILRTAIGLLGTRENL